MQILGCYNNSAPPTNPKSDLNRVRSQRREAATVITVGLTTLPMHRRTSPTLLRPSLPVRRTSPTERDGRILLDGALRWSVHSHPLSSIYHSVVRFIRFSTCSSQIERTTWLDSTLDDLWDLTWSACKKLNDSTVSMIVLGDLFQRKYLVDTREFNRHLWDLRKAWHM